MDILYLYGICIKCRIIFKGYSQPFYLSSAFGTNNFDPIVFCGSVLYFLSSGCVSSKEIQEESIVNQYAG